MNDFTKDELQEIKYSLHRDPFSAKSVKIKIQSMIDDYCQPECRHYWEAQPVTYKVETNPLTYDAPPLVIKCKHCERIANE